MNFYQPKALAERKWKFFIPGALMMHVQQREIWTNSGHSGFAQLSQ